MRMAHHMLCASRRGGECNCDNDPQAELPMLARRGATVIPFETVIPLKRDLSAEREAVGRVVVPPAPPQFNRDRLAAGLDKIGKDAHAAFARAVERLDPADLDHSALACMEARRILEGAGAQMKELLVKEVVRAVLVPALEPLLKDVFRVDAEHEEKK